MLNHLIDAVTTPRDSFLGFRKCKLPQTDLGHSVSSLPKRDTTVFFKFSIISLVFVIESLTDLFNLCKYINMEL